MFEKLIDAIERIATALERIAAYANAPKATAAAGKTPAKDDAAASPLSGKPSSASKPDAPTEARKNGKVVEPPADDGLGDEAITFEQMRQKLVDVKQHKKLGPAKSSAIFATYGKLPDIKESDYPKVVAECDKLLKSVA